MYDEPMRSLMVTLSAWRRLFTRAREMQENGQNSAGTYIIYLMGECHKEAEAELEKEAEAELEKAEKEFEKQMKKEAKK